MTIIVGAASPVGIVLASDSRMTDIRGERHRVRSDSTRKVFSLCETFGAATYGVGFIGQKTIDGLIDEFVATGEIDARTPLDDVAGALQGFFSARLREQARELGVSLPPQGVYPLCFLIAGYNDQGIGLLREVGIPDDDNVRQTGVDTARLGALPRGQTYVIRRLMEGIDPRAADEAGDAIEKAVRGTLDDLHYRVNYPVTLQDAVDLATFWIKTTIAVERFTDGTYQVPGAVPSCGGPIQVLSVLRAGAHWIEQPRVRVAPATADSEPS